MFVNSPELLGADTFVHSQIMRSLDRARFEVHAALTAGRPGSRTQSFEVLSAIPDLHLRPSNFGPSLTGRSTIDKAVHVLAGLPTLADLASLAKYIKVHRISLIHSTDRPRDAVACVLLAKLTGARAIVHVHVKYAEWMGRPVRTAMARADALVGVSKFVARSLVEGGYQQEKTYAVLNAIDIAPWDYRLDPGLVRREFGIPSGAPVVSCAARLFRGKGQDEVIRAIAVVQKEFPSVRLLIIGRDDLQAMPTSFTAELKALVAKMGLADSVIFTGHRTDMPALFAASDVFALASLEEPFGLVFLEAMAMKKPVVALDSGGAPEVLEHGRSGLLSASGDRAALAENLLILLRDPARRARMGEYGRQQVETRFTLRRMAHDIENVYDRLVPSLPHDSAA